ncbi:MAG: hypothetical protein IK062_11065 [Selenomonadaceae bacterium]|nr:hypothetical protein [Selenomonadaceae bacterium]
MSKPTEKVFKAMEEYIASLGNPPQSVEELQKILEEFQEKYNSEVLEREPVTEENAETADDYLELADKAKTKKKALQYVTKACELDANNIDAQSQYIDLTVKNGVEAAERYKKLLVKAEEQLKTAGIWTKNTVGDFWGIIETRPYMRVYLSYMEVLKTDCRLTQAADACKEILKLNTNDNLGIRYELMHIYAVTEDVKGAERLFKKYRSETSTQFLMPFSLIYYKVGNEKKAEEFLKKAAEYNSDLAKFFRIFGTAEFRMQMAESMSVSYYSPGTMSEIFAAINGNDDVYLNTPTFFEWGKKLLKDRRGRKAKNSDTK